MSETKFTPGPWKVEGDAYVRSPSGTVCDCRYKNGKVDAHLIAAAPDMYEALKMSRNGIAILALQSAPARNALDAIDAALAKAEGNS